MKQNEISKAIQVFRKNFKFFYAEICDNFTKKTCKNADIEELTNDLKRICLQLLIFEIVQKFNIIEKTNVETFTEFTEIQEYFCLLNFRRNSKLLDFIDNTTKIINKTLKNMRKCLTVSNAEKIQDAIYLLAYCFETIIEFSIVRDENTNKALKLVVSDNRKKSGAFFTPKSLVKYTVNTALDRIFDKNSLQDAAGLKICDPALGSGLFLVEAANYLAQKLCRDKDNSKFFVKLCENNFYGVDKNPLAIEISVISLKFLCHPQKLNETKIAYRFKVGDSLTGTTFKRLNSFNAKVIKRRIRFIKAESEKTGIYTQNQLDAWCSLWFQDIYTKELCDKINNFNISEKISKKHLKNEVKTDKYFHWELEFPEIFSASRAGFDAIISNPPYRSYYSRHSGKIADGSKHYERFADANLSEIQEMKAVTGRINYFLLFIVKATELLSNRDGVCAFVLPDTILMNESYANMRSALILSKLVQEATQFTYSQFRGASVGTSVLCWKKGAKNNDVTLKSISEDEKTQYLSIKQTTLKYTEILSRQHHSLLYTKRIQTFESSKYLTIDDIAFVKDGINPGKRYMREKLVTTTPGEKTLKLIEGFNIKEFKLSWSGKYIIYDNSKISSQNKIDGTSLRKQWIFDSPKIVYRQTSPQIIAAVDLHGFYTLNSVQNIILREHDEELLFALCGYLNSEYLREIYQSITGETRTTFPQVHVSAVKLLPIPKFLLTDSKTQHEIAEIARKLTCISLSSIKNDILNSGMNELKKFETREHLFRKIDIIINSKISDY